MLFNLCKRFVNAIKGGKSFEEVKTTKKESKEKSGMKTFMQRAAQGEIGVFRIKKPVGKLPEGFTPMASEHGYFVVGHSETGHHHVLDASTCVVGLMDRPPEGMRVLYAIVNAPTALVHLREHDTHDPLVHEPGEYTYRIGREFDPYEEEARQQAD